MMKKPMKSRRGRRDQLPPGREGLVETMLWWTLHHRLVSSIHDLDAHFQSQSLNGPFSAAASAYCLHSGIEADRSIRWKALDEIQLRPSECWNSDLLTWNFKISQSFEFLHLHQNLVCSINWLSVRDRNFSWEGDPNWKWEPQFVYAQRLRIIHERVDEQLIMLSF